MKLIRHCILNDYSLSHANACVISELRYHIETSSDVGNENYYFSLRIINVSMAYKLPSVT